MESVAQMLAYRPHGDDLLKLIETKENILRDAWLTEADHLRPGHKVGPPLPEAEHKAAKLDKEIRELTASSSRQEDSERQF